MLIARPRQTYIAQPPDVQTPAAAPQPPPFLAAATQDFRIYGLVGAGGSRYIAAVPPFAPNTVGIPPTLIATAADFRNYTVLSAGSAFFAVSHQLPAVNGTRLRAAQSPFTPDPGSTLTRRGGIDSLPPNFPRPLLAIESPRPYPPGSTFSAHGGPAPVTTVPPNRQPLIATQVAPPPYPGAVFYAYGGQPAVVPPPVVLPLPTRTLIAQTPEPPPHPGVTFFRIGSGDLNPIRPQHPVLSRDPDPLPTLLRGSAFVTAQHTDTLIQTSARVYSAQSYVPFHPGSVFTAHAPIDNGEHRRTPLIAVESPRPFPAGSVYYESGPPDNGLSYRPPLLVSLSSADTMLLLGRSLAGASLGITGSPVPPIPPIPPPPPVPSPAEICAFSADLTDTEAFSYDFDC